MSTTKKTTSHKHTPKKDSLKSDLVFKEPLSKTTLDQGCGSEKTSDDYDRDAELLITASHEIRRLREDNRVMTLRLDMFDKMYSIFTADGNRGRDGMLMGPEILYSIERRLEQKKSEKERKEEAKSKPQS